jgi:uncharacterized protein (DUF4415 family)
MSVRNTKRRSRTNWERVDGITDRHIDYSDIPPLDAAFFREAILWPGPKKQVTLRLDPDVLTYFRKQGKGYQSTINAVLRRYVQERKRRAG